MMVDRQVLGRRALEKLDYRAAGGHAPSEFLMLAAPRGSGEAIRPTLGGARIGRPPQHQAMTSDFAIAIWHSPGASVATDPGSGTLLLVHGDVFADDEGASPARVLLDWYLAGGAMNMASKVNGACAALIVSPAEAAVFVDRVSTRKVFYSRDGEGHHWVSSSLELQPACAIDAAGVASLIINRFQYLGRTVFEGVRSLERACVHTLLPGGFASSAYWHYHPSNAGAEAFDRARADREAELAHLLRQAVRRRVRRRGRLFISLSGGVDSRCALGALIEAAGTPSRICALSYGSEQDDDVAVAREICAATGIGHRVSSARDDLGHLVRANGDLHDGQVFFYLQGLDGLARLAEEFGEDDSLFLGDECFGWRDAELDSFDAMLSKGVGIRAPASVPGYYSYGTPGSTVIAEWLQADVEALRQRCAGLDNWHDCKDFLYLDQRLAHMLLPWRERYAGHFVRLANPFLDNDILDFMSRTPTRHRIGKRLFRAVAGRMFPALFGIRVAREGGVSTGALDRMFARQRRELAGFIEGFDSRLDAVLPPDVLRLGLHNLLCRIDAKHHGSATIVDALGVPLRRRWLALRQRAFDRRRRRQGLEAGFGMMALSPAQFATVLQLRWFLRSPGGA